MIDGETGLVFRAGSQHDLFIAIKALIIDHQFLSLMSRNARGHTLLKAPNSVETYSTILNHKSKMTINDGDQGFARAA